MKIKDLPPSERLDLVLRKLQTYPDRDRYQYFSRICNYIIESKDNDERNENQEQIGKIIEKLEGDDFIKSLVYGSGRVDTFIYTLTFQGEALLELEGGYSGRLEKEKKDKKKELRRTIWLALVSGVLGTLLGLLWPLIQSKLQGDQKPLKLEILKVQAIHDTIYIKTQEKSTDISLVRIVKLPAKNNASNNSK